MKKNKETTELSPLESQLQRYVAGADLITLMQNEGKKVEELLNKLSDGFAEAIEKEDDPKVSYKLDSFKDKIDLIISKYASAVASLSENNCWSWDFDEKEEEDSE